MSFCLVHSNHIQSCVYYIHVYNLKEAEVGVKCGSQVIPVLLYADDAVILAEDERSMRRGLDTLAEWCSE